jgi:hypothetical protein
MNPYLPIRKVPLDYNGIESSAYSVQMQHPEDGEQFNHWKEVGVVGHSYLLVDNDNVRKAANQVAEESKLQFVHDKTFFNGRSYAYSLKSDHVAGEVTKGDDVALGMQFWNSYDGSKAFGFAMMLYRLICTNGMMSKDHFNTYRFKHEPKSENWEENLEQVVTNINNLVRGSNKLDTLIHSFRRLSKSHVTTEELGRIRHNHLQEIPVGIWGQIVDRFTSPDQVGTEDTNTFTGWDLLNASTDLLWHKENPTITTYGQNAAIVDGLCRAVA